MYSSVLWPVTTQEDRPWTSTIPRELVSHRVFDRHRGPYRAAITPEIADLSIALPAAALAAADEATFEIARFDATVGNQVAPFAAILLRSESASSSRIENLTSGAKAIALAEVGATDQRNAVEIVGNVRAMRKALEVTGDIDERLVLDMHSALMDAHAPHLCGDWRTQQVWIGGDDYGPHGAAFIPPHHDRVPAAMADMLRFVARNDIPVLAHTALAHAQFETIHPFPDGNGRTGRALMHAMLRAKNLTQQVTVPIAAGLLTRVDRYFDALGSYREGDPVPIITQVAEASFSAITNSRLLVADITDTRARWAAAIATRPGSAAHRLADFALRQPVFDTDAAATALNMTPSNAMRVIDTLAAAGAINEFTGKKRNRMWQAREVLRALDDFAERAGRRSVG